jgi:outer membrane biogenesis lipoprotein LolB
MGCRMCVTMTVIFLLMACSTQGEEPVGNRPERVGPIEGRA